MDERFSDWCGGVIASALRLGVLCGIVLILGAAQCSSDPEWTRLRPMDFPTYVSSIDYKKQKRIASGEEYCFRDWCVTFGDRVPFAIGQGKGRYLEFSVPELNCRNRGGQTRSCSMEFRFCYAYKCGWREAACLLRVHDTGPGRSGESVARISCPEEIIGKKYNLALGNSGKLLWLDGSIEIGLSTDLERLLKEHPGIEGVVLNSNGGHVYEARGIAKVIRKYELDTYVFDECKSACTTVFISGETRVMGDRAELGFHQYWIEMRFPSPNTDPRSEQDKDRVYYSDRDIDEAFLQKVFDTPHYGIWVPDRGELMKSRVVHRIVKAPPDGG